MKSKRYSNRYGAMVMGLLLTGATMGCGGGMTVPGYAWELYRTVTGGAIIGATETVALDCAYDDVIVLSVFIGSTRQSAKIVSYDAGSTWTRKTVAPFRIFQTTSGLVYVNGTTVYRAPGIDTAFISLTTLPAGATAITSFSSAEADLCAVTASTVYWRPSGASSWSSLALPAGRTAQVNSGAAAVLGSSVFVATTYVDIQIAVAGAWTGSYDVDDDMSPMVMALHNGVVYYHTSTDTSPSFAGFNLYGEKVVGGGGGGYEKSMRWLCAFGSNVVAQEGGGIIYISSGGGLTNKVASDILLDDVCHNDTYQRLIGIVTGTGTFSVYTSDWESSGMGFTSRTIDANGEAYYSLQDGAKLYPSQRDYLALTGSTVAGVYALLSNYLTEKKLNMIAFNGSMTIAGVGNKQISYIKWAGSGAISIVGNITTGYTDTWTINTPDGRGSSIEGLVL